MLTECCVSMPRMLDEGSQFARMMREAGVSAVEQSHEGAPHGFMSITLLAWMVQEHCHSEASSGRCGGGPAGSCAAHVGNMFYKQQVRGISRCSRGERQSIVFARPPQRLAFPGARAMGTRRRLVAAPCAGSHFYVFSI
ncbi:unnamed protein product [Prorocentrum cordatum]|uniref:Alpha/beta hydrolase fold-3 domain-containing protein n=1 Tax=Prorocentrum cordatum TaxID=2364126 RepID=A0ABN9V506_9DINO|nr:unnamed protein product [Polarella glacialis]